MYRRVLFPVLAHMDAEKAHDLTLKLLKFGGSVPALMPLINSLVVPNDSRLQVNALGKTFASPLGIAAGLDKNAVGVRVLGAS